MAGREVNYAEALGALADAAENWPRPMPSDDWPTFAGSPARTKVAPGRFDLGAAAWDPISLGEPLTGRQRLDCAAIVCGASAKMRKGC